MARRVAKENPELNVTSFCDIITVSIFALFMVLVLVLDLAMRTPKYQAAPMARDMTNLPVYVEIRAGQLYPVDRVEISTAMQTAMRDIRERSAAGQAYSLKEMMALDIGNTYYRMDNSFVMMGLPVLLPRAEVAGLPLPSGEEPGPFGLIINELNTNVHYVVYLVRDDSFGAFRQARDYAARKGFFVGWEYLGREEPISFDGMFRSIRAD